MLYSPRRYLCHGLIFIHRVQDLNANMSALVQIMACLTPNRRQAINQNNNDHILWRIYASLALIEISFTGPQQNIWSFLCKHLYHCGSFARDNKNYCICKSVRFWKWLATFKLSIGVLNCLAFSNSLRGINNDVAAKYLKGKGKFISYYK